MKYEVDTLRNKEVIAKILNTNILNIQKFGRGRRGDYDSSPYISYSRAKNNNMVTR